MEETSVVIVDDHALVRQGLRTFLDLHDNMQVTGEAANGVEAVERVGQLRPDVVLMDLVMPEMDGIEATRRIRSICPDTKVIALTSFTEDEKLFASIKAGAISIGVGIDYSIQMTERFREELRRTTNRVQALRQASNGTGVALIASAASSIVGFTILGFAPMPMFSSFGFLTALMILLALAASLAVLPSLLLLETQEKATRGEPVATTASAD